MVQGCLDFGLGQAGVGAEFGDRHVSAGGLAELGADALEESFARVVAGAGELGSFLGVDTNLGHYGTGWGG